MTVLRKTKVPRGWFFCWSVSCIMLLLFPQRYGHHCMVEALSSPSPPATNNGRRSGHSFPATFEFASNGVCLQPRYFVTDEEEQGSDTNSKDSQSRPYYFTMRNVPGNGDCMFLAVALAAATSLGLGANDVLLSAISQETREIVAQVLSCPDGQLYIAQNQSCRAQDLLQQATREEGLSSSEEYLALLRKEGIQGGLYGGGPELTVLANILRRPISIYEMKDALFNGAQQNTFDPAVCPIICKGTFGDGLFEDPCLKIQDSAVLSSSDTLPEGAYSWHLHIMVMNVEPTGEKHACVLLPSRRKK